jgi:hypothetical protein
MIIGRSAQKNSKIMFSNVGYFNSLSLTPLAFVLFISCMILLIPSTVKSGFGSLVLGVADMSKAVSSPVASFGLNTKPN